MKRKSIYLVGLILLFFISPNYYRSQKFTKEEIIEDLRFIQSKIATAHINPYSHINETDFNKIFSTIESKVGSRTSADDFKKLVYPIFILLSDDHANIDRSFDFDVIVPLSFKYYNKRFFVTENFSPQNLTLGAELESVNQVKINDLITKCADFSLGNRAFKKELAYSQFLYLLRNQCLIADNYEFQFTNGEKIIFDKKTTKKNLPNYRINFFTNESDKGASEHIKYKKIDNENGYLVVNTFSIRGRKFIEWQKDIDRCFDQIKSDQIKNLYIDVSNNFGGNVNVGNMIIYRFTDQQYKKFNYKVKDSPDLEEQIKKNDRIDSTNRKILFPENISNRFLGKTYVIVGQNTNSAATIFATTVLDNELAAVIGETVEKGRPNQTGGKLDFVTPHTKVKFSFSSSQTKRPDESKPNQLIPNIEIDLTNKKIGDIIKFVDNLSL